MATLSERRTATARAMVKTSTSDNTAVEPIHSPRPELVVRDRGGWLDDSTMDLEPRAITQQRLPCVELNIGVASLRFGTAPFLNRGN